MDLRSFVTTQDQKDCKKCKKYLRGEKIKKTQSIVPPEIGRKYCKSCKSNYCTKIPNSEVDRYFSCNFPHNQLYFGHLFECK